MANPVIPSMARKVVEYAHLYFPNPTQVFIVDDRLIEHRFHTCTVTAPDHNVVLKTEIKDNVKRVRIFTQKSIENRFRIMLLDWDARPHSRAIMGYVLYNVIDGISEVSDYRMLLAQGRIPEILRTDTIMMLGVQFEGIQKPVPIRSSMLKPNGNIIDEMMLVRIANLKTRIVADQSLIMRPRLRHDDVVVQSKRGSNEITMMVYRPPTHNRKRERNTQETQRSMVVVNSNIREPIPTNEPSTLVDTESIPDGFNVASTSAARATGTKPKVPKVEPKKEEVVEEQGEYTEIRMPIYPHGVVIPTKEGCMNGVWWRDVCGDIAWRPTDPTENQRRYSEMMERARERRMLEEEAGRLAIQLAEANELWECYEHHTDRVRYDFEETPEFHTACVAIANKIRHMASIRQGQETIPIEINDPSEGENVTRVVENPDPVVSDVSANTESEEEEFNEILCPICGVPLDLAVDLDRHMNESHKLSETEMMCPICDIPVETAAITQVMPNRLTKTMKIHSSRNQFQWNVSFAHFAMKGSMTRPNWKNI